MKKHEVVVAGKEPFRIPTPREETYDLSGSDLKNAIIRYDNSLNFLDLSAFSLVERRFLMALLYKCRDRKPGEFVYMSREDFYNLGVYKPGTRITAEKAKLDLLSTLNRCAALRFHDIQFWAGKIPEKGKIVPLFDEINYDLRGSWKVGFCVSDKARGYLANLMSNFTHFPLQEFQELDSRYQQDLYRLMQQFSATGWLRIRKEDFCSIMSVPLSYRESDIDKRVLKPAIQRLSAYFRGLRVFKHYSKRGRAHRVHTYEFMWEPDPKVVREMNGYNPIHILDEFQLEFGKEFTQEEKELIFGLEDEFGLRMMIYALDEAAIADRRELNFIRDMVYDWKRRGITLTDLRQGKR